MPDYTHYYAIIGDGHVYGRSAPPPLCVDPLAGAIVNFFGATQNPVLNTIMRGATSGAIARVTDASNAANGSVTIEQFGIIAFRGGETINFDSGGSATVGTFITAGTHPLLEQYIPQRQDALTNSFVPNDGVSDLPWWDRNSKVARNINIAAGFTGAFAKGDRVTTSGGGAFTVHLVTAGAAGSLDLKVIRETGTIAAAQTVTNTTQAGGGTIATLEAATTAGNWLPFHPMPNVGGTGTYFEFIPKGNGRGSIAAETWLLRKAYEKHVASLSANDRGTRMMPFATFDHNPGDKALLGGVTVQTVECTGTFPTNWTLGETISGGSWSAKLAGFNATLKHIYVTDVNGQTLGAVAVTGATSGASATSTGAAYGFQKGSRYWTQLLDEITLAQSKPGALYAGSASRWEGVFLMIWEAELGPFAPGLCPWPTTSKMEQSWVTFITDLRTQLGRADLPIALWLMDVRSQAVSVQQFGVPFSYLLHLVFPRLTALLDNVTLVTCEGMEGSTAAALPYPSSILFLRTEDYLQLGYRAWRSLEFAQYVIPSGDFQPLPLIFIGGQSQAVGGISSAWMQFDRDPELYSSAVFPGVSSADPAVLMWNAQDNVMSWQTFDVAINGNTFFGQGGFSGLQVALAQRMKRRFSTGAGSAEIGFIHLPVNGSSCGAAGSVGPTWDPAGATRQTVSTTLTCTGIAATSMDPALGRFTGPAGTFAAFSVGGLADVQGSALGFLGSGGNNSPPYGLSRIYRKAADNSYVDLEGAFVTEGPRTFTLQHGPVALWPLVRNQVRSALEKCATQLRRVPKPVLIVWWNAESDLQSVGNYQEALARVLEGIHGIFGQKHKGETKTATVIMQLTRRTPWPVPDADIETAIAAQQAVAQALGNAAVVNTDKLPMESAGIYPRTIRQHNGVHHTPRGYIMAGYMADEAAGQLIGIPDHPDGSAAADFGADSGALIQGGTDLVGDQGSTEDRDSLVFEGKPVEDAPLVAEGAAASGTDDLTVEGAGDILDAIDAAILTGADIAGYTVNGRTVQKRSLTELIAARKHYLAEQARKQGLRRTRVRFDV
jgi:hypothetical protein